MAIVRNSEAIGIIRLKDVMKEGIKEKIQAVKTMGIRPVMITGDQPLTAKSIAAEVGIDGVCPAREAGGQVRDRQEGAGPVEDRRDDRRRDQRRPRAGGG